MKKRLYYIFGTIFLIAAASVFIDYTQITQRLANIIGFGLLVPEDTEDMQINREMVNDIYNSSFMFAKSKTDSVITYIPRYEANTQNLAEQYAELFGFNANNVRETEIAYIYENGGAFLTVYKFINLVNYEKNFDEADETVGTAVIASNEQAVQACSEFMASNGLPLSYSEAVVNFEDDTYVVTFVDKLANMLNYAFPTVVVTDASGDIISADYYFFGYDRLSACSLKTMKQAFYELPVEFPYETQIDIKRCTLVYFYENSILQPAYLFEGEFHGGGTFRCFVNAARYGD